MGETDATQTSILVVDDTRANLLLLTEMLTKRGYVVRASPDGRLGLMSAQTEPPDLILLDIMMPHMDGYETCEKLKADARTRDIPVIFLSALSEVLDKVKAFAVGGVDFVSKPFQMEEILARIETHLALRKLQKDLQERNAQLQQEIAERELAQAALEDYARELEARNDELDAFAHTVAHDLKNPLGLVSGYADMLAADCDTMESDQLRQFAQSVVQGARRAVDIVDSLLLLTSARKIDIVPQTLDMAEVLTRVWQRLAPMIEEQQAEIVFPETWPRVESYGLWVEAVWANYISNAIKYGGRPPRVALGFSILDFLSDDGRSEIRDQEPEALHPESRVARFWVRDNGPGLTEEEQAQLFTPFTRLHKDRAEGHGLGLSIVQRIVEKLGGKVGVESQLGQGSTFYFTLPGVVKQD